MGGWLLPVLVGLLGGGLMLFFVALIRETDYLRITQGVIGWTMTWTSLGGLVVLTIGELTSR